MNHQEYVEITYVIYRVMLWCAVVLGMTFPVLYHITTRGTWSFTPIGRHIMRTRAVFALLLLFTAISVFIPAGVTLTAAIILFAATIWTFIEQIKFVVNPRSMDPKDVLDEPVPSTVGSRLLIREEPPPMKSRPVVITMSILAALQFLFGGLVTLNLPDDSYNATILTVGAFGTLAVAAAQSGIQFYVQNLVTPHVDVAAFRDHHGEIVAGPAAPPEGSPVDVVDEDTGRLH